MKKIIFGVIATAMFLTSAYAYGVLTGYETDGTQTTCYYSDGSEVTVFAGSNCPNSN